MIDALGLGGGAEHSLANMLPLLADRGVSSSIVTLIPRDGGLQERLRAEGYPLDVLSASSWPGRVRELRRHIDRTQPDLVHATLFKAGLVARFACVGRTTPLLESLVNIPYDPVVVSMSDTPSWKIRIVREVDGVTARHLGGHFHAVSEAVRDHARSTMRIDADRITVVRRGRDGAQYQVVDDAARARARAGEGLDPDALVILNVGRQDPSKSQPDLVRAFARLVGAVPRAVLLVAGREGSETGAIERAIAETGTSGSVHLLGHRTDLANLYAMADVFALPSRFEGAAGSLVEAMAMGLPAVGSDAQPFREILDEGTYGLIVPRGDIDALAAALERLGLDEGLRAELGAAGRRRFEETYEVSTVADATVAMYRDRIGPGANATA